MYGYGHQHHHHHYQQHQEQQEQPRLLRTAERPWTQYCDSSNAGLEPGPGFTFASWNVLATSLISHDYLPYLSEPERWEDAQWECRKLRVFEHMKQLNADIFCLQEVEVQDFWNFFRPHMLELGYDGHFMKRTADDKKDGCATFVRKTKAQFGKGCRDVDLFVAGHSHLAQHNVCLVSVVDAQDVPAGRNCRLVIGNLHLVFSPKRGDSKLAQLQLALTHVEDVARKTHADAIILSGDFNLTADSALYRFIRDGGLALEHMDRRCLSGQNGKSPAEERASGLFPSRVLCRHQGSGTAVGPFTDWGSTPADPYHPLDTATANGATYQNFAQGDCPSCHESCNGPFLHHDSMAYAIPTASLAAAATNGASANVVVPCMDPAPLCKHLKASLDQRFQPTSNLQAVGPRRDDGIAASKSQQGTEAAGVLLPPQLWGTYPDGFVQHVIDEKVYVAHRLTLQSAYAQKPTHLTTGEPAYTTFHARCHDTVDYVLYGALQGQKALLRCSAVLEPPLRHTLAEGKGLPNKHVPSDHVPLCAHFWLSDGQTHPGAWSEGTATTLEAEIAQMAVYVSLTAAEKQARDQLATWVKAAAAAALGSDCAVTRMRSPYLGPVGTNSYPGPGAWSSQTVRS
eukprot:TRINITY_DN135_c0_g1_i2.p1 TRINITY_DN135_c0_g1~~TRINITY_DN135_c0_g1_i2.p1  ORF type:complete len:626 (+),score=75.16 TRINITY_DN135_c0_g1_i2:80-1957(+)